MKFLVLWKENFLVAALLLGLAFFGTWAYSHLTEGQEPLGALRTLLSAILYSAAGSLLWTLGSTAIQALRSGVR